MIKTVEQGHSLNDNELLGNMGTIFIAAVETVGIVCSYMLYYLAKDHRLQEEVRKEVKAFAVHTSEQGRAQLTHYDDLKSLIQLRCVMLEVLRMHGPSPMLALYAAEDIEIANQRVPRGTHITVDVRHITTASKESEAHLGPNLDKFVPTRWLDDNNEIKNVPFYSLIPFGYGGRVCIGKELAESESMTLIATLLLQFQLELSGEMQDVAQQSAWRQKPIRDICVRMTPLV